MYFAFIGNVKDTGNGNYVFNMYDVMETKTGRCNLTEMRSITGMCHSDI